MMNSGNIQSPWRLQIEKIGADIRGTGESILTVAEVHRLCPGVAVSVQWEDIAKMAINQKWAFTFFPNGDVRFENL